MFEISLEWKEFASVLGKTNSVVWKLNGLKLGHRIKEKVDNWQVNWLSSPDFIKQTQTLWFTDS